MKLWQKITVGVMALIVAVLAFLLIRGLFFSGPGGDQPDREQNPVFPFDPDSDDGYFGPDDNNENEDEQERVVETDALWQVTDRIIAGASWVNRSEGEIWYVLKENGHVYTEDAFSRESTRLINTTIPQVQEALIAPNGEFIVYRYLEDDTIKTYIANTEQTEDNDDLRLNGSFVADNIESLVIAPNGNQVFYLQPANPGVVGIVYTPKTEEREVVWRSPVRQWRLDWPQNDIVTLTTAPSRGETGFSYSLNPDTGNRIKLTEGDALTALYSRTDNYLFAGSYADNRTYSARISEVGDQNVAILSPETLASKCGWASDAPALFCGIPNQRITEPLKNWYQGRFSFTDQLYRLNSRTNKQFSLWGDDQNDKGPFDITSIRISQPSRFLSFVNKRDGSLWAFEL